MCCISSYCPLNLNKLTKAHSSYYNISKVYEIKNTKIKNNMKEIRQMLKAHKRLSFFYRRIIVNYKYSKSVVLALVNKLRI